jgi:putative transposase
MGSVTSATDFNTGRHVVIVLHAHVVFTIKSRRGALTDRVLTFLRPAMAKRCADFEAELEAFDGAEDHVHLLVRYPPNVALSTVVHSLKAQPRVSSARKGFPRSPAAYGATTSRRRASAP